MTRVLLAQEESTIAVLTGSYNNNNNKSVKTKMFWSNAVFLSKKPFPNVQNNCIYKFHSVFQQKDERIKYKGKEEQ
jgi:hypothetical protein